MSAPPSELDRLLAKLTPGEQADILRLYNRVFTNGNENDELLVMLNCLLMVRSFFNTLPERAAAEREALAAAFTSFSAQLDQRLNAVELLHLKCTESNKSICDGLKQFSDALKQHSADYANTTAFLASGEYADHIADKMIDRLKPTLEASVRSAAASLKEAEKSLVKEHLDFVPHIFGEHEKRHAFLMSLDHLFTNASLPKAPRIVPWLLAVMLAGAVGYMLR